MSILPYDSDHHTFHAFDVELDKLNGMLLNITELLSIQLELSILALEKCNSQYAADSIALIKEIEQINLKIDFNVLAIIAKFWPVANDLRAIITLSKIAGHLEKTGDEIADFALFVKSSLISGGEALQPGLLSGGIEIGRYVLSFLHKLKIAIETNETDMIFSLLEASRDYEIELYNKLQDELIQIIKDKRNSDVIKAMQIIKLLEFCPGELRRIFAKIIFNRLSDCAFRHKWISEAAYYLAEHRNFMPGFEIDDWLTAEKDFLKNMIFRYESIARVCGGIRLEELKSYKS